MASRPSRKSTKAQATPASGNSRLRGWLVILAVALATAVFFLAGTIDPATRYNWIGL